MSDQGKVALIMNCYNSGHFLEETLDSLVAQTYQDYHIFCFDNRSTDDTWSILQRFEQSYDNITAVMLGEHVPLVKARIAAIDLIRHVGGLLYFAFCDSDDLWDKHWLASLMSASNGQDLLFSNGYELRGQELVPVESCMSSRKHDTFSAYLYLQSVLFSVRLINAHDFLDPAFPMLYDMDLLITLKRKNVSYVHLSTKLFTYRVHAMSLASSKRWAVMGERYRITRKHKLSNFRFFLKALMYLVRMDRAARWLLGFSRSTG